MKRTRALVVAVCLASLCGCGGDGGSDAPLGCYRINSEAEGCTETVDHIVNTTVTSRDENVLKAEYNAGYVQGKLQRTGMLAARDNTWDGNYLVDPSHSFPAQLPPTPAEKERVRDILWANYAYTVNYAKREAGSLLGIRMSRLIFRLLGIYHGAALSAPAELDFSGTWLPDTSYFAREELALQYETDTLSFMDVYWLNANQDVMDVISYLVDAPQDVKPEKCSAFVKKTADDVIISHNTWMWFLSQAQALNLSVNGDILTMNLQAPGLIVSLSDFGYNNKGILFNETTHHATYTEPRVDKLWMFMRAALAEQFAESLDEFYDLLSLEASGTYMNGYMAVDAKTKRIGLIEMSYRSFVYFRDDGQGGYDVLTKPSARSKEYDRELVAPAFLLGINYPASLQIREDLQALDTRPQRRVQLLAGIGGITDLESARDLITYTDPANPLSIFGRWDLGTGVTPKPKTVPDGSIDAKVASASMALPLMRLRGNIELNGVTRSFWMKFGTPTVNGEPFIWSKSQWKNQKLRLVPDAIDGSFQLLNVHIE